MFTVLGSVSLAAFAQGGQERIVTTKPANSSCNPVTENTLPPSARSRSASPCEIEFEGTLRRAIKDAFGPFIASLTANGWTSTLDDTDAELTEVDRGSERSLFRRAYTIELNLTDGAIIKGFSDRYQAMMTEISNSPTELAMQKLRDIGREQRRATQIRLVVAINDRTSRIAFFKGGQQAVSVPGASYAVRGSFVAPLTGGGVDDSNDGIAAFIGQTRTSLDKSSDSMQGVLVQFTIPSMAPPLSVQSIAVRLEGGASLIERFLKEARLTALDNLKK
jgi:hypothetical protein